MGAELVSGREAEELLSARASHRQAWKILKSRLAGPPIETRRISLFEASRVRELADLPSVDIAGLRASPLASERFVVLRVGPKANEYETKAERQALIDAGLRTFRGYDADIKDAVERRNATRQFWLMGESSRREIDGRIATLTFQPVLVSVGGLIVDGWSATRIETEGGYVAFDDGLSESRDWFSSFFERRWLRTRPGAPWCFWSVESDSDPKT